MKKKKMVIFDMDGLLLDTERIYVHCWQQTFSECNITIESDEINDFIGIGFDELKRKMSHRFNGEAEFHRLRNYRETLFWAHIEKYGLPIKTGSVEILKYLQEKGVLTALATSTHQSRAKKLLKYANLNHIFDFEVYGDQVEKTKPNPDLFNYISKISGVEKDQCIIFEDSYNGVRSANSAGIDVVWIKDMVDLQGLSDINMVASFESLQEGIPFLEVRL